MRNYLFFAVLWGISIGWAVISFTGLVYASDLSDFVPFVSAPEDMEQKAKWVAEQTLVSNDDRKLVDFYWTGMFEGMSRLKSGHLNLKREVVFNEDGKRSRIVLYDFYFDYTKDLYRFERVEKGGRVESGKDWKHVFVKNKDVTLFYDGIVVIKKTPTSESPHYLAVPFDARYVGLLYGPAFDSIKREEMIESCRRYFQSSAVRTIATQTLNETVLQVTSFIELPEYPLVVEWVHQMDSVRGFTLGKLQCYERLFIKGNEKRKIAQDMSFDYKEFGQANDKVWLPVKWVEQSYNGGKLQETVTMTLQWSQVNEPLSDEHFTLEGMNVTDGIFMIDKRLGEDSSIIEGQIEGGKVQLSGEAALRAMEEEANKPAARRFFFVRICFILSGVVLIFIAVYRMIRDARRQASGRKKP